jgi:hypothetical protein
LLGEVDPVPITILPAVEVEAVPPVGLMPKVALAVNNSIKMPVRTIPEGGAGINEAEAVVTVPE